MTNILFLLYTALFGASFFVDGNTVYDILTFMTGAAVFFCFLRSFYLTVRRGYIRRKYLGKFLIFLLMLPHLFLPARAAAIIAYAVLAGWHYAIPFLRLVFLRLFYTGMIKKACRERNHTYKRVRGGMTVRTPGKVYDIRLVGSFRRMGVVKMVDDAHYTMCWVPTYVAERPDFMWELLGVESGVHLFVRRLLIGRVRTRSLRWSDAPDTERVLLFLPGLCEWQFRKDGQAFTNGSHSQGVALYEADLFVENRLR